MYPKGVWTNRNKDGNEFESWANKYWTLQYMVLLNAMLFHLTHYTHCSESKYGVYTKKQIMIDRSSEVIKV